MLALMGALFLFSVSIPWVQADAAGGSRADSLGRDLISADVGTRRTALSLLGESPRHARAFIPLLLQAMNDPDAEVQWRAEFALGRVGAEGVPQIAEGLRHSEAQVRRASAYVLGPMGPTAKAAVPDLLSAAGDADASVRVWAVMALGLIDPQHPRVIPVLAKALRDTNEDVVRVACRIVIKLGPEAREVLPSVLAVLDHARAELRWLACIGLRQMGAEAESAVPRLIQLLKDPDGDVRNRATQALSRIGPVAERAVRAALEGDDSVLRERAPAVLAEIKLRDSDASAPAASIRVQDPHAAERARWYNEAKFGLFIHWGLYAVPHRARPGQLAEWIMDNEKLTASEYERFVDGFTAQKFNADEWMQIARTTGARYVVLTSKHHDGFCLWDTQLTDNNSAKTVARRDIVGQLAAAAERAGLKFCLYYSMLDWHHPDYEANFPRFVDWMHRQLRELLTRYPLWGLWFDGEWTHSKAEWRGDDIIAMTRQLRPLAFLNDRLGRETRGTIAGVDFYTKEQEIPRDAMRRQNRPVAWETCQTFGYSWGYNESPDALKSGERLIEQLVDVVSKGGNFLLNIGPRPDGTIPEFFQARMKIIGQFLKTNGEAIYGTDRSPFGGRLPAGRVTTKGNRIYIFLEALPSGNIALPGLENKIQRAYLLATGEGLSLSHQNGTSYIASPSKLAGPVFTVVAVELDGLPRIKAP